MIWNEAIETMPRSEIERLQSESLSILLKRIYQKVPFYREKLNDSGIQPEQIGDIRDLAALPFTRKSDLRDHYPFGLFAVPMEAVRRIHASSGTTGKPTVVGYTVRDLKIWAELCARCFALSGAHPGDVFQNAYGYGLFTGGLGMHYGAERMGMAVIPVSGGNTVRQVMFLKDFSPQILACTPSYALTLADMLAEMQIDPETLPLRTVILGAEPWIEAMRQEIESKLKVQAVNIYGLSEIMGPGVSNECVEVKDGSHIPEDHFLPEVIDPESGRNLPAGEVGELVFTTLTKEALPLLRYRTGDLASLDYDPCGCGRTHVRMSRVLGRVDDMLIIRGVNVFPSQIEEALTGIGNITSHHQIVVTRKGRLDQLEVRVEVEEDFFRHIGEDIFQGHPEIGVEDSHRLEDRIQEKLLTTLGINARVTLLAPGTAPRSNGGKLKRVDDRRQMNS